MIQDFKCTYGNSAGIREAVTNRTNLTFPDAYKHAETMAELAQVLKECDKAPFCELMEMRRPDRERKNICVRI